MTQDRIQGRLVFGDDATPFRNASIELIVEDTTYADGPAVPVARQVLPSVAYEGERGGSIPFVVHRDSPASGRRQTLRVLVDVDGDGKLGPGDYRNAHSVPIPPGSSTDIVVPVLRIR